MALVASTPQLGVVVGESGGEEHLGGGGHACCTERELPRAAARRGGRPCCQLTDADDAIAAMEQVHLNPPRSRPQDRDPLPSHIASPSTVAPRSGEATCAPPIEGGMASGVANITQTTKGTASGVTSTTPPCRRATSSRDGSSPFSPPHCHTRVPVKKT
jgi:hypothetical protein